MTRMLASVRTAEEAETVLSGGADIIDLKDPGAGSLGALPVEEIGRLYRLIAGRAPVSAVCGDLPMEPETIRARGEAIAATGVDYVKVGFFPSAKAADCARAGAAGMATGALTVTASSASATIRRRGEPGRRNAISSGPGSIAGGATTAGASAPRCPRGTAWA